MGVELSSALLAGILAAQVAQLGFEGRMLARLSTVETKVEERTERRADGGYGPYEENGGTD